MPNSLRSLLARLWPETDIDPARVGLSHVYLTGWDKLTPAERTQLFAKLKAWPDHIGLSALVKAYVVPTSAVRRARTAPPVYTPADAAIAYIDAAVDAAKPAMRTRLRAALTLMYSCGMTGTQLAALDNESFVTKADGMLLVTPGYVYVLTPGVRSVVAAWLAECPTPQRPFSRMVRMLNQHKFLSESYSVAQSN